jgi:senataxin
LVIVSFFRYCLWILGDAVTLLKSNTVWKKLVIDAMERGCFYDANEDKTLAQAITAALAELEKLDILPNNDSLLFKEAIWKVHAMFWLFYAYLMS